MRLLEEQKRRAKINSAEEAKIEQHFRGQQELPNGRNFRCFNHINDPIAEQRYRDNYDNIFRNNSSARR